MFLPFLRVELFEVDRFFFFSLPKFMAICWRVVESGEPGIWAEKKPVTGRPGGARVDRWSH